jgi:hypothetical protein
MIRTRALLVAAALIAMTGCGGSSGDAPKAKDLSALSATAILAKAKAQVAKESNVSIAAAGDGTGEMALKFDYSGNDSAGTLTTDGGVLTLLNVDGVTYYKPDNAFWTYAAGAQATGIIAKVKGRWIRPTANSSFADFLKVAERSALSTQILTPKGTISKGRTKTVNGVTCIALEDGETGALYVDSKTARPIQITSKTDGALNFSYDAVDIPDAPTGADVVDEADVLS